MHMRKREKGFTLMEAIIALAIALMMLTALLSLQIRSTMLATQAVQGFHALPYAIERMEEVAEQQFSGTAQEFQDNYEIRTVSREARGTVPMTQIQVEVLLNGESCSQISMYKFTF